MRTLPVVFIAIAAGYIGGAIQTRLFSRNAEAVVRAHRYELLRQDGTVAAEWSRLADGEVALRFQAEKGAASSSIGLNSGGLPFVNLGGSDGRLRATIQLGERERPTIFLSDANREGTFLIGFLPGDFGPSANIWGISIQETATSVPRAGLYVHLNEKGTDGSGGLHLSAKGRDFVLP